MTAFIIIPYREDVGDPMRRRNLIACLRALHDQGDMPRTSYEIVLIEQDKTPHLEQSITQFADLFSFRFYDAPYNRAKALNAGVRVCKPQDDDILCLLDADLLVDRGFIGAFLRMMDKHEAVLPFSEVLYLDPVSSQRAIIERLSGIDLGRPYEGIAVNHSVGGCVWIRAGLYRVLGGHDEGYIGWGCADQDFSNRMIEKTDVQRLPERLLHLYHQVKRDNNLLLKNRERFREHHPGGTKRI